MGSSEKLAECDVGLGLKMQQQHTISKKKMMTMPPHHHHHHHESRMISSPSESGIGSGSGGPIFCSGSNQVVACMSDVYDVVGSGSGSGVPTSLQHFNNSATVSTFKSSSSSSSSASSSGGIMAESGRVVTFTPLQWEELERQTMIYKYIMASIPIPSQLLFAPPTTTTTTTIKDPPPPPLKSNRTWGDMMGNTNTTNGSDREPWRCRRTDGKKWRCSRDVAPDQKYCERHAHKNKPRSRKPVELLQQQSLSKHPNYQHQQQQQQQQKSSQFLNQTDHHLSPYPTVLSSSPFEPRYSDWFMKGGGGTASVSTSNNQQQWQQLMQPTIGLKRDSSYCYKNLSICQQQQQQQQRGCDESLNAQNDQCSLLLGPKLVSTSNLDGALNLDSHTERPRDFISAWSRENNVNEISSGNRCCSVSSNGKLPLSSLSLSMAGDSGTTTNREDEEVEDASAQMGGVRSHSLFNWMSPGSWMGSTPGGPLAEALCLGMANNSKLVSNPAASPPPNGNGGCNSGTTNSSSHCKSPSGDNSSSHGFNLI